jgi:hypothetical protein
MRRLLVLGVGLAVLAATCSAQDTPAPRAKHFHERTKPPKGVPVGKTPTSATPEANLRRLEQQATKLSAPQKARRAPGKSPLLKTEKEKPTPPIRFSGSNNGAKGPGTTTQGTNPYRGRLRQKGSHH